MDNVYGVPKSQWGKWNPLAQHVFNTTYGTMLENQLLFLHPMADCSRPPYWKTTCWNAAWTAAEAVHGR